LAIPWVTSNNSKKLKFIKTSLGLGTIFGAISGRSHKHHRVTNKGGKKCRQFNHFNLKLGCNRLLKNKCKMGMMLRLSSMVSMTQGEPGLNRPFCINTPRKKLRPMQIIVINNNLWDKCQRSTTSNMAVTARAHCINPNKPSVDSIKSTLMRCLIPSLVYKTSVT